MLFIFSTPGLIRHLWQIKTVVFLHWCLICAVLLWVPLKDALKYCSYQLAWTHSTLKVFLALSRLSPGNTKGGSITLPLTSCLTGLESAVRLLTIFVFIWKKTGESKPVKQEVNGTVILPHLVFPGCRIYLLDWGHPLHFETRRPDNRTGPSVIKLFTVVSYHFSK